MPDSKQGYDGRAAGNGWIASALGAALFAVYALGACPTIYVGDSGELVTAVHVLGIPHPTGYPLYVLLGKAWTLLLPVGSVAWRMSLFSAVCAALACAALFALLQRMRAGRVPALFAGLLLGLGPTYWTHANVQLVYALSALFVVLATSAAWRWYETRTRRWLSLSFFLCGLGATNHTFMGVFAIGLVLVVLAVDPALWRRPGPWIQAALATAVGLLPYVYLPLRSRMDPPLDWGDPETLEAFLNTVLRRDFWGRAWIESPADLLPIGGDYVASLFHELAWVGAGVALVGLFASRRLGRFGLLPPLVMAANVAIVASHGSRTDIFVWHRYYMPSYVMAALLAGLGLEALRSRLPRALWLGALALPAILLATGWSQADRSRYRIADAFSRDLLEALPPGATLAATDDNVLFVLMYLKYVEALRPDVDVILQGVGDAELPPLRFNPDDDPVFFTHHPNWNVQGLEIVPVGLAFRAWRSGRATPLLLHHPTELPGEHDPRVPKDFLTQNLIGHFHFMLGSTAEATDWPRARREYLRAAGAAPDNDVLFYNLGLVYGRAGLWNEAEAAFRHSQSINPRHIAEAKRPRAADRVREAEAERRRLSAIESEIVEVDAGFSRILVGSPAWHERMAERLTALGEPLAALGHRLRASEIAAAPSQAD